ncbi:hypothetical protein SAMN05660337_0681 [Maridesulfovibrio ferrireducens]|uniref:Lipoprotein n=1 Tax=Maridesulfovibrio ferrireducens TaxID=246191 RepID=A0A1G9CHS0_9BACT|nr:hypothetical protein [Maridesulfovibrio ferrireducens]SDK51178.1 hypothetical protein SAMN05660337_0681 [Maridesulfovibrio ferrireducens]
MKIIFYFISIFFAAWIGGCINEMLPKDNYGFIFIENQSGEDITKSTVQIRELIFSLPHIPDKKIIYGKYLILGDSHYEVNATLKSGKRINISSGYMTSGLDSFDLFIIKNNKIDHKQIPNMEDINLNHKPE